MSANLRRTCLQMLAICAGAQLLPAAASGVGAVSVRRLRQRLTLNNPQQQALGPQKLWLYVPAAWPGQMDLRWQSSHPARMQQDRWGHRYLALEWEQCKPFARQVLQLDFTLDLQAHTARREMLTPAARQAWLQAEPFIESDHAELIARALALRGPTPLDSLHAAFDWVAQHIQPGPYQAQDLGALYALRQRQGDCTEYADLLVALARAQGIPARMVGGWVCTHDGVLDAVDYHNWAECWLDGCWLVLDAQRRQFDADPLQYLAWRCQRAPDANPLGAAHRWRLEGQMQIEI